MTYAPGENVGMVLRHNLNSAPSNSSPNINRFRQYNYPNVGDIRFHYGHANDPKNFEKMTHGIINEKNYVILIFNYYHCQNVKVLIFLFSLVNHLIN